MIIHRLFVGFYLKKRGLKRSRKSNTKKRKMTVKVKNIGMYTGHSQTYLIVRNKTEKTT